MWGRPWPRRCRRRRFFTIAQGPYQDAGLHQNGRIWTWAISGRGKAVTFKVDAFPKDTFHGVVSQVRMNPTTVQSVVTYDTIIEFANPEMKLFPGMTAYVTIPVDTVQNVLKGAEHGAALQAADGTGRKFLPSTNNMGSTENEKVCKLRMILPCKAHGPRRPAQKIKMLLARPRAENAVVWKLHADNTMEPVKISLGITDHAYTQVASRNQRGIERGRRTDHSFRDAEEPKHPERCDAEEFVLENFL